MKKTIALCLAAAFVLCFTACAGNPNAHGVRKITSADVLGISESMSADGIMATLGETLHRKDARAWFLYIVDDMQYLQFFADARQPLGISGAALLENIRTRNTEIPPRFLPAADAVEALKSIPMETAGWEVEFANSDYVYFQTGIGQILLRYNLRENKIDKALDCREFLALSPLAASGLNSVFLLDGNRAQIGIATSGEALDSAAFRDSFPFEYSYTANFSKDDVALLSKEAGKTLPVGEEATFQTEEEFESDKKKYVKLTESNTSLPQAEPGSWFSTVAQINERLFFVMTCDAEAPQGFWGYRIFIVDVIEEKVLQESFIG